MNGVNLLRLHSSTPYGYALTLVDTLFTREEQHQCLMFKSKKSEKPALDPVRVEKILGEYFRVLYNCTLAYLLYYTHCIECIIQVFTLVFNSILYSLYQQKICQHGLGHESSSAEGEPKMS